MNLIEGIRDRRTVRKFKPEKVSKEIIEEVLNTALYAPNAGNRQQTQIVVCSNEEIIDKISRYHSVVMTKFNKGERNFEVTEKDLEEPFARHSFYHAPTVIMLFAPKNFYFSDADSYIVAQNICLTAHEKGIATGIIGEVLNSFDNEYGRKLLQDWNMPDGYVPYCYVTFGYLDGEYPKPHERKYKDTIYVDN